MRTRCDEEAGVAKAVISAFNGRGKLVLAVSGGLDSMVLLSAASRLVGGISSPIVVATFDHATGPHSAAAVKLVCRCARKLGLECVSGIAGSRGGNESEWREGRWKFLREVAAHSDASVVTAHTLDDQIETVFMRILRDAGPRGLSGLYAESEVVRPFLKLRRASLEQYARANRIEFVTDPSNFSRSHLRNRIRHDLLPAISQIRPSFSGELIGLARQAADWRQSMASAVETLGVMMDSDGGIRVARPALDGYDAESLRTLWPSIAAEGGFIMDRRGTHRLAEFTMQGHTGGSIQLSGGIEVKMFRDHLLLRRWDSRKVELVRNSRRAAQSGMVV